MQSMLMIRLIIKKSEIKLELSQSQRKNANTKYKKIKKKTVLVVGDSMVNSIEESTLLKTRHIRVQPIPGGKIEDIQQKLKDLLHEDLSLSTPVATMQQQILRK